LGGKCDELADALDAALAAAQAQPEPTTEEN
jgi:hypothetical protein